MCCKRIGQRSMSDEVLRELPGSWQWATIADLGDVVSGGTPSTEEPSYALERS